MAQTPAPATLPSSSDLVDAFLKDLANSVTNTLQMLVKLLGSGAGGSGSVPEEGSWLFMCTGQNVITSWIADRDYRLRNVVNVGSGSQWVLSTTGVNSTTLNVSGTIIQGAIIAHYNTASDANRLMNVLIPRGLKLQLTNQQPNATGIMLLLCPI